MSFASKNVISRDCDLRLVVSNDSCIDDTAPFKFDAPSPDDVVSNGLRSSKAGSKGTVLLLLSELHLGYDLIRHRFHFEEKVLYFL